MATRDMDNAAVQDDERVGFQVPCCEEAELVVGWVGGVGNGEDFD